MCAASPNSEDGAAAQVEDAFCPDEHPWDVCLDDAPGTTWRGADGQARAEYAAAVAYIAQQQQQQQQPLAEDCAAALRRAELEGDVDLAPLVPTAWMQRVLRGLES